MFYLCKKNVCPYGSSLDNKFPIIGIIVWDYQLPLWVIIVAKANELIEQNLYIFKKELDSSTSYKLLGYRTIILVDLTKICFLADPYKNSSKKLLYRIVRQIVVIPSTAPFTSFSRAKASYDDPKTVASTDLDLYMA